MNYASWIAGFYFVLIACPMIFVFRHYLSRFKVAETASSKFNYIVGMIWATIVFAVLYITDDYVLSVLGEPVS